jgi:hypothetical protein
LSQNIPVEGKEDIAAMLDSLQELFQEHGDKVTATLVARRMEKKLHRHVHYRLASYLYILLGFETRRGQRLVDKGKYYVVPNPELLAEKRAQFCDAEINDSDKRNHLPVNRIPYP